MIRLDCGAGTVRLPGFIGLDRFALPGAQMVADLDRPLPMKSDSVHLILACHSLEHVRDLMATLREIWRVCADRAQVCIIAPYGATSLNLANPYHLHTFNEHTPRFWTDYPYSPVDRVEYADSGDQSPWGLGRSDHSDPGMDFCCIQMEMFYALAYRELPRFEQIGARRRYLNVCEEIVYHLIAVKQPLSRAELMEFPTKIKLYEPPSITERRAREGSSLT